MGNNKLKKEAAIKFNIERIKKEEENRLRLIEIKKERERPRTKKEVQALIEMSVLLSTFDYYL